MKRYKYKKKNRIMLLLILVIGISVGYSLLSSNLKIDGYSGINKNTWDIHWNSESIQTASGSVTPKEAAHVDQEDNKSVSFDVELELPGDFYEFTLDAKNYGSIDGAVDKVIIKFYDDNDEEIETLPPYINYSFTYNDGTPIEDNKVIKQNESEKYKMRVEFDRNAKEIPTNPTPIKPVIDVDYEQFDSKDKYVITYNTNGGNPTNRTSIVEKGKSLGSLPSTTRDGYTFDGWYTGQTDGVKIDKDVVPSGNTTYYAHWRETLAEFDTGQNVNAKFKALAGDKLEKYFPYFTPDNNITAIRRSETIDDSYKTEEHIVSASTSRTPIYAWFDNGTIYWWSETSTVQLNRDSSYLFSDLYSVTNIDLSNIDSSNTEDMSYMFGSTSSLMDIDLSHLDTSSVTNMECMFKSYGGNLANLDLSHLDTSNVTNMYSMFEYTTSESALDLTYLDVSSAVNMASMFYGTNIPDLDLNGWDTKNVEDMSYMFSSCSEPFNLNLSGWDTRKVVTMQSMFDEAYHLQSLDISGWDMSGIEELSSIFSNSSVETINVTNVVLPVNSSRLFSDLASLTTLIGINTVDTSHVTDMERMFSSCRSLTNLDLSSFYTSNVTNMDNMFDGCENLVSLDLSGWDMSNVTTLNQIFSYCNELETINATNMKLPSNSNYLFSISTLNEIIGLNTVDTSHVIDMSGLFSYCSGLTSLDLSGWDISKVTDMSNMLYNCSSLTSLDLSGWDISKVTDMSDMFYDCNELETINVTNMVFPVNSNELFSDLSTLTTLTGINTVDTSHVTDMSNMFEDCSSLTSLDLSSWDTSKVTDMSNMFYNCSSLTSLNLSGWNTSNVTRVSDIFVDCDLTNLNLSGWNVSNITNIRDIFSGINVLNLNLSDWDVSNITNLADMFYGISKLKNLNVSGWDMSNATNTLQMFENDFEILNVTNMKLPSNSSYLFSYNYNLKEIIGINTVDVSNTTNMKFLFYDCSKLTSLDLSNWNISNVTDMSDMFANCSSLTSLDLSGWNTSNVTIMSTMFENDSHLTTVYVGDNWSTENVSSSDSMFSSCDSLVGGAGTTYDYNNDDKTYARVDGGESNPGYFTYRNPVNNTTGSKKSISYTVYFNANGGENVHDYIIVKAGNKVDFLPTPTRDNYKFLGWYTGLTDGVKVDTSYTPVSNMTLYARWIEE